MDKGYDIAEIYEGFESRNCRPIIPLKPAGKRAGRHLPHECCHGTWQFKGIDYRRGAAKWRCPTGECETSHRWIPPSRHQPLIPRTTQRWKALYNKRGAVEREFGRLKDYYGIRTIRVRGIEKVRLHVDLSILAKLSSALSRAR